MLLLSDQVINSESWRITFRPVWSLDLNAAQCYNTATFFACTMLQHCYTLCCYSTATLFAYRITLFLQPSAFYWHMSIMLTLPQEGPLTFWLHLWGIKVKVTYLFLYECGKQRAQFVSLVQSVTLLTPLLGQDRGHLGVTPYNLQELLEEEGHTVTPTWTLF